MSNEARSPGVETTIRPDVDGFLPATDGLRLYYAIHECDDPQGVVLLFHGLGEHGGRYQHVLLACRQRRLQVVRMDLRGHGKSEGQRGHSPRYEQLMEDLSSIVGFVQSRYADLPLVLLGHSLGGNLVANWCLRRPDEARHVAGVVLSAPWFELAVPQPRWKVQLIRLASKLWPSLPIPARFRPRKLSRDPEAIHQYEHDPLVHHQITARMVTEAYDAGHWALEHASEFSLPLLAVHGTSDTITSLPGTVKFCERVPHAEFVQLEGLVHEPHNEPEWPSVVARLGDWIVQCVAAARRSNSRRVTHSLSCQDDSKIPSRDAC